MTVGFFMPFLIVAAVCWPLFVALLTVWRYFARPGGHFANTWRQPLFAACWMSAPVPAIIAYAVGEGQVFMSWLMMGACWETGGVRGPFLGFTAMLWLLAGIYAHGYMARKTGNTSGPPLDAGYRLFRFAVLWPLALAGNLLLIVAADIPGFYAGYALMTFSAYVLVIHDETEDARRGGAAYIMMAVLGESLVIGGLLIGAGSAETIMLSELSQWIAESPMGWVAATLLWLGFGVKAGVAGLHAWLPMAHPVAPTPASAVLSGAMIKAGLAGWIWILPAGTLSVPGYAAMGAGLAGAYGAVLYGVFSRNPKVVLAYSSVSQMGMITSIFGLVLVDPSLRPAFSPVLVFFAAHHGLSKGALFLGAGITGKKTGLPDAVLWIAAALPALSLAGVAGSGLIAKWAVKTHLYETSHAFFSFALTLSGAGTALLMARALFLQWRNREQPDAGDASRVPLSMTAGWLLCVFAAMAMPWWFFVPGGIFSLPPVSELPGLLWPGAAGTAIAAVAFWAASTVPFAKRLAARMGDPAPGDLWRVYARASGGIVFCLSAIIALGIQAEARLNRPVEAAMAFLSGLHNRMAGIEPFFRVHAGVLMAVTAMLLAFLFYLDP